VEYSRDNPDDPSRSPAESKEADYQINAGNGRPVYFNDSLCGLALILNRFAVTASVSILSADGAFFVDIEKSFETSGYGIGVYDEEYSESDYNEHDPGAKRLVSEGIRILGVQQTMHRTIPRDTQSALMGSKLRCFSLT